MVAEYRVGSPRAYALPRGRTHVSEILAMTLLVVSILYVYLQTFTFVQVQPVFIDGEGVVETQSAAEAAGGSLLNRIVWVLMLAGTIPLLWRYWRRLLALLRGNVPLLLALAFCFASVTWALDPAIAARRYTELLITTIFSLGIVVALPSPRQFVKAVLIASSILIVLDLAIIPAMPWLAFNYLGEFEGVHKHKNLAGVFCLTSGIVWFFAIPRFKGWGRRLAGLGVLATLTVMLFLTQSKTSLALLPISIFFAWLIAASSRRGQFWFALAMFFMLFSIVTATLPLGVVSPLAIVNDVYGDVTFTGRTLIWNFMLYQIEQHFWTGVGYGSFWAIGADSPNLHYNVDLVTAVGQAHNGYLDVAATIGMVGLGLVALTMLSPFLKLFPIARDTDADDMHGAGIAIMVAVLIGGLVHNVTESSLLRSGHPMWFFILFAILYLSVIQNRVGHHARQRSKARSW